MQQEVYNAAKFGVYTNINATAIAALGTAQTRESIRQVKADLRALADTGMVAFRHNFHGLLNEPNSQTVVSTIGAAQPTTYHNLSTLVLDVIKLK